MSSQGEAFTAVAADGSFLTHAMVSFDTRASTLARTWPESFGRKRLYEITGHTAHPMFTLFKVLWVRDHLPGIWEQTAHVYCFEELLHLRLGLEPAISYPLAGRTMMFNVRTLELVTPRLLDELSQGSEGGGSVADRFMHALALHQEIKSPLRIRPFTSVRKIDRFVETVDQAYLEHERVAEDARAERQTRKVAARAAKLAKSPTGCAWPAQGFRHVS